MRRSWESSASVSASTPVFLQSGCNKSWISLINNVCDQMESVFLHVWGHTFPFFDLQVSTLKALVQGLGHGFVVWVMVLSEIGVSQSFGSGYSLVRVQNQHLLEEVHSLKTREHFICEPSTEVKHWALSSGDILTWKWTSNCMLEKGHTLLPSGLAPRNTSAKFLLGMHGRELM